MSLIINRSGIEIGPTNVLAIFTVVQYKPFMGNLTLSYWYFALVNQPRCSPLAKNNSSLCAKVNVKFTLVDS